MHLHPHLAKQLAQARRFDLERMSTRRRLADVARRRSESYCVTPMSVVVVNRAARRFTRVVA
jgi:hypothetical protein